MACTRRADTRQQPHPIHTLHAYTPPNAPSAVAFTGVAYAVVASASVTRIRSGWLGPIGLAAASRSRFRFRPVSSPMSCLGLRLPTPSLAWDVLSLLCTGFTARHV